MGEEEEQKNMRTKKMRMRTRRLFLSIEKTTIDSSGTNTTSSSSSSSSTLSSTASSSSSSSSTLSSTASSSSSSSSTLSSTASSSSSSSSSFHSTSSSAATPSASTSTRIMSASTISSTSSSRTASDYSDMAALPLGDVNLIVLTDVHSWIAGHERHHEPFMNADYGTVLSFYERLRELIVVVNNNNKNNDNRRGGDLFLVMNGDFMDGTGLSTIPPIYLTPLLENMPLDIINVGNHELYYNETVDWITKHFIPHLRNNNKGHYLSSNTMLLSKSTSITGTGTSMQPLGSRYTLLKGDHSTLLVFGFLYNFEGACASTIVERVQDVVQQEWFTSALLLGSESSSSSSESSSSSSESSYDAILVMAHMHVTDPLVEVIRVAIRTVVGPDMPIQFITGHTHIRAFVHPLGGPATAAVPAADDDDGDKDGGDGGDSDGGTTNTTTTTNGTSLLDYNAASFEAGRFLDTIGFCSFPTLKNQKSKKKKNTTWKQKKKKQSPKYYDDDWTPHENNDDDDDGNVKEVSSTTTGRFEHVFLDPNRNQLASILMATTATTTKQSTDTNTIIKNSKPITQEEEEDLFARFDTPAGLVLSQHILDTQQLLGLDTIVGCSSTTYQLNQSMDMGGDHADDSSLWALYMYQIVPTMLFGSDGGSRDTVTINNYTQDDQKPSSNTATTTTSPTPIFVQGTGAFRYNLFQGVVTLDDVIAVCPFNDTIYQITTKETSLSGLQLLQVLNITTTTTTTSSSSSSLSTASSLLYPNQVMTTASNNYTMLPSLAISTNDPIHSTYFYDLYTSHFHLTDMVQRVERVLGRSIPKPRPVSVMVPGGKQLHQKQHYHHYWTTTNLWQSFIQQEWPCSSNNNSNDAPETTRIGALSTRSSSSSAISASSSSSSHSYNPTHNNDSAHRRPNNVFQEERPLTVVFFIVLILGALYVYQKRKEHLQRSGYIPLGDPTTDLLRNGSSTTRPSMHYY